MHLTTTQARRIALAAQGFTRQRPGLDGDVASRHVNRIIERLGFFQIDSVNVLARAHYMPLFSRLGPYDQELLHRAASRRPRRLFEYWAHEAALVDVKLWQAFQFRMESGARMWGNMAQIIQKKPEFVAWVLEEVREKGPLTAREVEHDAPRDKDNWGWNWSEVKMALEYLFYKGQVTAARRNSAFERVYDLPERVLPRAVLEQPTPTPAESVIGLVRRAARALGVADEFSLRDYFRTRPQMTRDAIAALVEAGELIPVLVEGWEGKRHYLWHQAALPRRLSARALLSPFDSMIFERARLERLFDFVYRIEIYVPEPRRVHGYYVYPFLLGDRFAARVDLKADRAREVLRVNSAWLEPGHDPAYVAAELAEALAELAAWQGLSAVQVLPRGDLATALLALTPAVLAG
jgi:uncharacterized protein